MNPAWMLLLPLFGADPPEVEAPQLISAPPRLERALQRRDLALEPVVEVTLGTDGVPTEVRVVRGPGPRYEAAILAAAKTLRFSPARVAGVPRAVRLEVALAIDAQPWQGVDRRAPEAPAVVQRALSGQVLERGTRTPLAGLPVVLDGGVRETLTDADGRFAFDGVSEGAHRLAVPAFDHEPVDLTVRVPGAPLVLRLAPKGQRRYRTVVQGRSGDAVRVVIPMERAREVAGSAGDPVKVIESLPGVARPPAAGPNAGQISVRGSAPEDTKFYVDGLPLFQLYHFGNIYSVLQDEWISTLDYRPGGFSAEFGDATGGLLNVGLADLRQDGVHGHLDANVYHAAVLLTAPLSDTWTVGAAFRRSYVDAILSAVVDSDAARFSTAPRYYDYQLRADWRPDARRSLRLTAFGTDDLLELVRGEPDANDPSFTGFSLARAFHQLQGTWTQQLDDALALRVGVATSYQRLTVAPGGNRFDLTFDPITARAALDWRGSKTFSLRGGVDTDVTRFKVEASTPAPTKEGQLALPGTATPTLTATDEGFAADLAGWAEATWRPADAFTVVGGLRLTGWLGDFGAVALDPRLTLAWDAAPETTVTVAAGLNHQAPAPDETSVSFGNPALGPEHASYLNLGVRQALGDALAIDVQGFYKALGRLVTPTGDRSAPPYDNAGAGWVAGAELLVRLTTPVVDGWLSYTLSRSRRSDRPGAPERFYSADQTHVLALVAGVSLGAGWRVGGRLRYATGNPYTPLEAAWYDASADVFVPRAAAAALSRRLAGFFQLDLRVDKTFLFETWELKLYLELNNATNRANLEQVGYNLDYTAREDINGLPLVPSLGLRARF